MATLEALQSAGPTERVSESQIDARSVARFWDRSLTEHVDPIEEAAADECLTSRAALGLDIHEAKGLSQWLSVTTPRELWLSFARHARDGALDEFAADLERSLFSSAKSERVLQSIRAVLCKRSLPAPLLEEVAQVTDLDSLGPLSPFPPGDSRLTASDKMPAVAPARGVSPPPDHVPPSEGRPSADPPLQMAESASPGADAVSSSRSGSSLDRRAGEGSVADQPRGSEGGDQLPQGGGESSCGDAGAGSEQESAGSEEADVAPSGPGTPPTAGQTRASPGPAGASAPGPVSRVPVDARSASEAEDSGMSDAAFDEMGAGVGTRAFNVQPAWEKGWVEPHRPTAVGDSEDPDECEALAVYTAARKAAQARPVRRFLSALVAEGTVHLEDYLISGPSWQAVCETLQHPVCPVQELHVAGNALGDAALQLEPALGPRCKLRVLDLSNNRIRPSALRTLVHGLAAAPLLGRLVLRGNRIDDRAAQALARTFRDAPALRALDVADNDIGDAGATALAGELCAEGRELRSLTLSWNRVGPAGASAFAESLKARAPLQELDLGFNAVGEMGGVALMAALPFTFSLQRLSLAQNRCGPLTAFVARAAFPMNSAMEELSLAHNPVGGVARELLGGLLGTHPSLQRLGTEGVSQCRTNPSVALDTAGTNLDMARPDGAYALDLSHPWQRAVAELLRAIATHGRGRWRKALWNKVRARSWKSTRCWPRPILVAPAAWEVPTVGTLEVVVETNSQARAAASGADPSPSSAQAGNVAPRVSDPRQQLPEARPPPPHRNPSALAAPGTYPAPWTASAPTGVDVEEERGADGSSAPSGQLPPLVQPRDPEPPRRPRPRNQGKRGLTLPAVEDIVLRLRTIGPRLPGGPVSARVTEAARQRERDGGKQGGDREGIQPQGPAVGPPSAPEPGSPRAAPTPLWRRLWKVDGLTRDQYEALLVRVCGVRFSLDLSTRRDRRLAHTIALRVESNPDEMVEEARWSGEPIALYPDGSDRSPGGQLRSWLEQQARDVSGVLELRLITMALHHQAHHCLRLSDPGQRRKACLLLQCVWSSRDDRMGGDLWANCRLDNAPLRVATWLEKRDPKLPPDAPVDEIWRIPAAGVLEFDYVCRSPEHVSTDRYRLDLSSSQDRHFAQDLRMRCALNPGDCMWGATVDGNPMDVATPEGMRHDLPRFGILEFDFVVLRPPEVLNAMRREHIVLDLGDAVVHFYATLLHRRITRVGMRSRELWLYPVVNGRPIPSPTCSSGLWQVPPEGELRFELAYHCPEEPVGSMQLDQLSQDLQEATSDAERLQMLAAVGEEPSVTAFFFSGMVVDMVTTLESLHARTQGVKHLLPRMLDAHNAFKMLQPLLRDATIPSEVAAETQQHKALFALLSDWTARGMAT